MKIVKEKDVSIEEVIEVLKNGGLVIFPSETVYGVAADATNETAIKTLNKFKKRPYGKPYSIAVTDIEMANKYAFLNSSAKNLYKQFLPGPMTVVSKGKGLVAKGVESEVHTLGIRIPDYPLIIKIIKRFGKPITATSANASFKRRPYKISDIFMDMSDGQKSLIDLVIDAGTLPTREPSTVIDTTTDDNLVLRLGDLNINDKNEVVSQSPESTQNVAKEIWQKYEKYHKNRSIVFALKGEMGSGKTVFTKGLAKAMGLSDTVTSPTYNLENVYDSGTLKHIDVWRLKYPEELKDLNLEKSIEDKSVVSIEWADRFIEEIRKLSEDAVVVWVEILYGKKDTQRIIFWGIEKG